MSQLEQQMRHRDKEMVPTFLVKAMFGLMAATIALVAYAQLADVPQRGVLIETPIVESVDVTLTGDRNGKYIVTDENGNLITTSADHLNGFIGVIGRSVDHERHIRGIVGNPPIQVVRRENGNVGIIDGSSGMVVDLIGYGKDNVAAFAKLLD